MNIRPIHDDDDFKATLADVSRPVDLEEGHLALSHNDWLMEKVEAAKNGLLNGSNQRIEEDEWKSIRDAKEKQRKETILQAFVELQGG